MISAAPDNQNSVILIDGSRDMTGALVGARNISQALGAHADVILVVDQSACLGSVDVTGFAAVEQIPLCLPKRSLRALLGYVPCLLVSAIRLKRLSRRHRAGILVFNDFYFPQAALLRLLLFTGPIVTWVRMDPRRYGRIGRIWLWFARVASTRIVAVSWHIQRLLGAAAKAEVIYDPAPAMSYDPEADSTAQPNPPTFVFIGNYIEGKGQDIAVEAFAHVKREFPDARLEFYGGDLGHARNREFRLRLESRAAHLGISSSVAFGGFAREPARVLAGKRGAINLSRSESYSMTVLEASAAGLPVIATRCGGPEEILRDGETGILIGIDDAEACAAAILQMCRDPKLAAAMGRAGQRRVEERFSEAEFRRRVLHICSGE